MSGGIEKVLTVRASKDGKEAFESVFATNEAVFSAGREGDDSVVGRCESAAGALGAVQARLLELLGGYEEGPARLYELGSDHLSALLAFGALLDWYRSLGAARLATLGQLAAYAVSSPDRLMRPLRHLIENGLIGGGVASEDDPLWLTDVGEDLCVALGRPPVAVEILAAEATGQEHLCVRIAGSTRRLFLITAADGDRLLIRRLGPRAVAETVPWAWAVTVPQ